MPGELETTAQRRQEVDPATCQGQAQATGPQMSGLALQQK